MPMPTPVIAQVMPSVSWTAAPAVRSAPIAMMKVGEIAAPARNSDRGQVQDTADEQQRQRRQRASDDREHELARPAASSSFSVPKTSPTINDPAA